MGDKFDGRMAFAVLGIGSFLIVSCLCIGIALAYDGGPACFLFPKQCSYNTISPETWQVEVMPEPQSGELSPLPPTPTQWLTPTLFETPTPEATPTAGTYVSINRGVVGEVDCGPNPYKWNDVGNRWERNFHIDCYGINGDPFEAVFGGYNEADGLNLSQVQQIMALLGLDGYGRDYQIAKLAEFGLWNERCGCMPPGADFNTVISNQQSELSESMSLLPDKD